MAMMITRFHKLIQSKTVWYIILGVVVVTFVGFFTPTMQGDSRGAKPRAVGELYGRKVMPDEYRQAWRNSYLWYVLMAGRALPMTDDLAAELDGEAWRRLAALHKADQEKIVATDPEVIFQIQVMPVFSGANGTYDARAYRGVLDALGVSAAQVEALVREQIRIQKLLFRASQAALVSPAELTEAYHMYTDRFVLEYAVLPRGQVEQNIQISREEAKAYFDANTEAFRVPARVRVSYVEVPVSNYLAQVSVPDGAVLEAYNRNIEKYRIENTNGTEGVAYRPFDEVQGAIVGDLRTAAARRAASAAATEFVVALSPKAEGERPDFRRAAAAAGLEVKTLPAFGPSDPLKGIDASAPFRQAAFSLENDPYACFSDAVAGQNAFYVLSLEQLYPSFVPEFEAVEKDAAQAARVQAAGRALAGRAGEIRAAAGKALAGGASFADAVKPFGLDARKTEEFDLSSDFKDDYADELARACLDVPQGGLCEPAAVNGGMLIAYVAQRKITDPAVGLPAVRQELTQALSMAGTRLLTAEWQDYLLKSAGFKKADSGADRF